MNHYNFLGSHLNDIFNTGVILHPNELELLQQSYYPNQKASIITAKLTSFCYIADYMLHIKLRNNITLTYVEHMNDIIYYITSYLIEKSAINNSFNANIILKKSHIDEYLTNIIVNLYYIAPTPIPEVVRPNIESTSIPEVVRPEIVRGRPVIVFDEENARECSICLENKLRFIQTNCNHLFCTDCFPNIQNNSCPLCRANI